MRMKLERRRAAALALLAVLAWPASAAAAPRFTGDATACDAAPADATRLELSVHGVRSGKGLVTVTVYGDKPADFLASGRKLARLRAPAVAGVTRLCIAVPPRPAYAIAVYHDEDGDRTFGRTLLGLPAEGYGFSRDAPASLGLPDFEDARFTAPAGIATKLDMTLSY